MGGLWVLGAEEKGIGPTHQQWWHLSFWVVSGGSQGLTCGAAQQQRGGSGGYERRGCAGTLGQGQVSPDPPGAFVILGGDAEALLILHTPAQGPPLAPLTQVPVVSTITTLTDLLCYEN